MAELIQVDLVTPEAELFSGEASSVRAPAHDGSMGFLYNRAPVMSSLSSGELRIQRADDMTVERFAVLGGFLGGNGQRIIILANRAARLDNYEQSSLEKRARDLETELEKAAPDAGERAYLQEELNWTQLLQRLLKTA